MSKLSMWQKRAEKKITQSELSEKTGLTQTTISFIENGVVRPQPNTKRRIEEVLGEIDWIKTKSLTQYV